MRDNQIRDFFYIRNISHPTTVVYDVDWENSSDGSIKVLYGVSHCWAYKDQFSKRLGRKIAVGRLTSKPSVIYIDEEIDLDSGTMWHNIRQAIAKPVLIKITEIRARRWASGEISRIHIRARHEDWHAHRSDVERYGPTNHALY